MKKLFVFLGITICSIIVQENVFAQPGWAKAHGKKHKHYKHEPRGYYYYPSANVYYSPINKNYWYLNGGAWLNVQVLPAHILIVNQPRHEVFYDGVEVWRDNIRHSKRYKKPKKVVVINAPPPASRPRVSVDISARF